MNMESAELIFSYFPHLSDRQREQFSSLEGLYRDWNEKINVISRKDMDAFWIHHVLHSLAIALPTVMTLSSIIRNTLPPTAVLVGILPLA